MAGGAGNEYYFGYQFDENDIVCEDWRKPRPELGLLSNCDQLLSRSQDSFLGNEES